LPSDYLGEVEDYRLDDSELPVELLSFEATSGDRFVRLNWSTASELEIEHYELTRQGNTLTRIVSQGNSVQVQAYEYVDTVVAAGQTYNYELYCIGTSGIREWLASAVGYASGPPNISSTFALQQNYPNPFNSSTEIRYDLSEPAFVNLTIFDITGRELTTLVHGEVAAGPQRITWNANAAHGEAVGSGIYILRLQSGELSTTRKMLLLR
jgi:hypothetical protein